MSESEPSDDASSRIQGTVETEKVLEDANVKLGNVLADVFGVSGQLSRSLRKLVTSRRGRYPPPCHHTVNAVRARPREE
jgi:hypothetical protein